MYNMTTFNIESKIISCFLNSKLGVLGVSVTKCGHRQSTFVYEYFTSDMEMILSGRKQELYFKDFLFMKMFVQLYKFHVEDIFGDSKVCFTVYLDSMLKVTRPKLLYTISYDINRLHPLKQ